MKKIILFSLVFFIKSVFSQSAYYIKASDSTLLYIREFGRGQPLIMLAGGPGLNAVYMKGIWDSLSLRYRCIVMDQRGTGKSIVKNVDANSASMDRYMDDLEMLRKHLQVDRLILIGHSWGGMLSLQYASKYPERVSKLILLDPGGPTTKFFAYVTDNIMMRLLPEDLTELRQLDSLHKPNQATLTPGYFFDRKRALIIKSAFNYDSLMGQPGIPDFTMSGYIATEGQRTKLLGNYKGPVFLIQGRQDPIGESTAYEIKEYLPQTQIRFIERCGHMPWLENAEPVTQFFKLLEESLK